MTAELLDQLSRRMRRLLDDADALARYGSTHKLLAAVLGGMRRAGWTQQQALAFLLESDCAVAAVLRRRLGASLVSNVQGKWRAVVRRHDRHAADCDRLTELAFNLWPCGGRERATLRVLLALIELAREAGSLSFTASVRRIGGVAGVGWVGGGTNTVRRSLSRLVELGVIERQDNTPEQLTLADTLDTHIRFTLPKPDGLRSLWLVGNGGLPKPPSGGLGWTRGSTITDVIVPLHPLWEEQGLGMTSCRVWAVLACQGDARPTLAQIAQRLCITPKSLFNALRRLDEARLAERADDGTWRPLSRSLDDVAEELGVHLRGDARRRSHELHRHNRAEALRRGRRPRVVPAVPFDDTRAVDTTTGELSPFGVVVLAVPSAVADAATVMLGGTLAQPWEVAA